MIVVCYVDIYYLLNVQSHSMLLINCTWIRCIQWFLQHKRETIAKWYVRSNFWGVKNSLQSLKDHRLLCGYILLIKHTFSLQLQICIALINYTFIRRIWGFLQQKRKMTAKWYIGSKHRQILRGFKDLLGSMHKCIIILSSRYKNATLLKFEG